MGRSGHKSEWVRAQTSVGQAKGWVSQGKWVGWLRNRGQWARASPFHYPVLVIVGVSGHRRGGLRWATLLKVCVRGTGIPHYILMVG